MRTRTLAAVAIAAWSKTALAAPTLLADTPAVADTSQNPHPSSSSCVAPPVGGLTRSGTNPSMIWGVAWAKGTSSSCAPGTLSLQASADGAQWKTLSSAHTVPDGSAPFAYVQHSCLPGTWSYRQMYAMDDRSFKASAPVQQFTC